MPAWRKQIPALAQRFRVVGKDWGGGVAWTVAIDHPEAVDRLAVLNWPYPAVMSRALRSNWAQVRKNWYIWREAHCPSSGPQGR